MNKIDLNILALPALTLLYLPVKGQDTEYFKVPELEGILNSTDNKLHVINFWATWYSPGEKFQDRGAIDETGFRKIINANF